jgi:hypothetical protein
MEKRESSLESLESVMEDSFKGYYKNKRVIVTGHTGFKGAGYQFG